MTREPVSSTPHANDAPAPPPAPAQPLPADPYTIYSSTQKLLIILCVSIAATFSAFSSNIYFPAIPSMAKDLDVSTELITLTVTSYMIFQGIAPSFWAVLADAKGRRITYIGCFLVLIGSCIGLANVQHYYQLVILRCLQSAGSASTIAVGAGVTGDITTREERGGLMGIFQAFLLMPVAVGPVIGGALTSSLGWRSIFWFLTIYAGVYFVVLLLFLPETLRKIVGNGSYRPQGLAMSVWWYLRHRKTMDTIPKMTEPNVKFSVYGLLNPLKIVFDPQVAAILFFLAIFYSAWQMVVASMSTLFVRQYGLSELHVGLTFFGNGFGCIIGTLTTGRWLDIEYKRAKRKFSALSEEDFPLERVRLRSTWLWSALEIASVLVFGWTLDKKVHISVPIICTFILGWASTSIQGIVTTYIVDLYHSESASAGAALNFSRCLMGAGATAIVLPIINAIGTGWTFSMFSGILVLSMSLLFVQMTIVPRKRQLKRQNALNVATVVGNSIQASNDLGYNDYEMKSTKPGKEEV